ncbi:MAG: DUF5916 domain-containing protein [Acidobacteria bacterium]|nr:DUF5916 domain-containing protein [Acidobacteriota bacterium]
MRNCAAQQRLFLIVLPLLYALASPPGYAQSTPSVTTRTHGQKTITAVRTELPVTLDGNLDEPAWQAARISLGFVQKDPQEGEPSTERTEFRVLYTATTLYIGVICYDSNAEGILASERRRDDSLENDDTVSIVLDTFHDHRNGFLFRTNPLGTQYDALITDEGRDINANWDEKWSVASQISTVGWTAEFAIPFKSLRMSEENGQGWGLDLERVIRRKNEFSYWNSFHRGFLLENISQGGHLEGLKDIETGLRLRIKPYLLGGFVNERRLNPTPGATDAFRSTLRNTSDVGLEVLKYRITPSLTADITWNTDFAQTEVDDQQVNLDRFSLFFPEKREFFLEGAGVYEFGVVRSEGRPVMKLFHSRQIGLHRGQPVPIIAGGRITGKTQGFTVGILNVQTEALPSEDVPASNYGVLRVKRDVLSRSTVGGFLINREIAGSSDFNRVFGADVNFVFFQHFTIGGLLGKSSSPGIKGNNWVSSGETTWDSDFFSLGNTWVVIGPDFRNDAGFIPRKDMRQFTPQISFRPRPNSRLIRQLAISARSDYTMNQNNQLETRVNHYTFEFRFQSGDVLAWSPHTRLERLREPFEIRSGVVIPPGTYSWWYPGIRYVANPARKLSGNVFWQKHYGFFGGELHSLRILPRLRLSEQLSVEPHYTLNRVRFPAGTYSDSTDEDGNFPDQDGAFTDHIVNARVNYNFNNQWLTSTTIQYNSADSFLGFNFRLNYIFRPGDDFFLVYNEGRRALFEDFGNVERRVTGVFDGRRDRSLQVKLTYSFDY